MSDSETWGELRSVLHRGGEPDLERLVEVLGGWSEPERDERLIAYLTDHLDPSSRGVAEEPPALPLLRCWMRGQLLFLSSLPKQQSHELERWVDLDRLLDELANAYVGTLIGSLTTHDHVAKGTLLDLCVQGGAEVTVDIDLPESSALDGAAIAAYLERCEASSVDSDTYYRDFLLTFEVGGYSALRGVWPAIGEGEFDMDLETIELMPYLSRFDDLELFTWFELAWKLCARYESLEVEWLVDDQSCNDVLGRLWAMYRAIRSRSSSTSG